jgi:hypothetical protein
MTTPLRNMAFPVYWCDEICVVGLRGRPLFPELSSVMPLAILIVGGILRRSRRHC